MADVQALKDKIALLLETVAAQETVEQSLVTLVGGLGSAVKDLQQQLATAIANSDFAGLSAVADGLDAIQAKLTTDTASMAAAVTANTPAAPATPPADTPPADTTTPPADTPPTP